MTACGSSLLGDDDAEQAVLAGGDPAVAADEVEVVGAVHQQLGHDGVVVVRPCETWQSVHILVSLVGEGVCAACRRGPCAARWC